MGPQLIGPPGQTVPNQFTPMVLMDKWSPTNFFRLDKLSLKYSICPGGQAVGIPKYEERIDWGPFVQGDQILGDHLSMETEFVGDHFFRGINFMGMVCPGGQEVGDQHVQISVRL